MIITLALATFAAVFGPAGTAALKYDVPPGWVAAPPASSMRVAEFKLPKAPGDAEDASLVLYFLGGQGGSVQANLDRWTGQMVQPDGRPSNAVAKTMRLESRGLPVTLLDVPGTYVAQMSPGGRARADKPGFRLMAAVVETPAGPYFVKLTGPASTVARWHDSVLAFLKSLRLE